MPPTNRTQKVDPRDRAQLKEAPVSLRRVLSLFTGHRSERNLRQFRKLGYQEFKTEPFTPAITWIYLQKERP